MTEKIDPFRWFGVRTIDERTFPFASGWEVYDTASGKGILLFDSQRSYHPENHAEELCDALNNFYIDLTIESGQGS